MVKLASSLDILPAVPVVPMVKSMAKSASSQDFLIRIASAELKVFGNWPALRQMCLPGPL